MLAAGATQVCAGQSAGCEAAIHALRRVFEDVGFDGVLLVDADNAFNRLNRAVAYAQHSVHLPCAGNCSHQLYRTPVYPRK